MPCQELRKGRPANHFADRCIFREIDEIVRPTLCLDRPPAAPPHTQYEADSAPSLALQATIDQTTRRFDNYAKQGLLCGTDGLPHLISDPGFALKYGHAGDVFVSAPSSCQPLQTRFMPGVGGGRPPARHPRARPSLTPPPTLTQIPTFGFLYVAGWIGHSGRKYLQKIQGEAKPIQKEIIIDYPLALRCIREGLGWPIEVAAELRQKTLLEDDDKITVSPR